MYSAEKDEGHCPLQQICCSAAARIPILFSHTLVNVDSRDFNFSSQETQLLLQQILKNSKRRFRKSSQPKSFCLAKVWKSPFAFPAGNGFRCSSRRRGRRSLPTSTHPQNFFLAFGGLHHNPFRFSDPLPHGNKKEKAHAPPLRGCCSLQAASVSCKTEN
jgi:hypothetical protein